jgi:hypothetical protein
MSPSPRLGPQEWSAIRVMAPFGSGVVFVSLHGVPSLPHERYELPLRRIACPPTWRTTNDDLFRRSTAVQIVAIGWAYVVLMMVLAEALGPGGSVLGAIVTLLLYGVLPIAIVLYVGGARGRARARRQAATAERAGTPGSPASGGVDPGGGGQAAGDAVASIREEA